MSSEEGSASAAASAAAAASDNGKGKRVARTMEEVLADPRFKRGVQLTKERKYDEAMEFLGALVGVV